MDGSGRSTMRVRFAELLTQLVLSVLGYSSLHSSSFLRRAWNSCVIETEGEYEGQFQSGKRHGRGTYYHNNNDRYEGAWSIIALFVKASKMQPPRNLSIWINIRTMIVHLFFWSWDASCIRWVPSRPKVQRAWDEIFQNTCIFFLGEREICVRHILL